MSLYLLKPKFQGVVRPLATWLVARGVTANQVTAGTAVGCVLVGVIVTVMADVRAFFLLIPLVLLVRMAFNAIDGLMAREFGQRSRLGAYLNELGDVVSDVALMLPFAFVPPVSPWAIAGVAFLAMLVEFAGALGPLVGVGRQYAGPMGKSDRALVFGALGLWVGLGNTLGVWVHALMAGLALLSLVTLVSRVHAGVDRRELMERRP